MTIFRPCIDLHDGIVKQIVGGTLSDDDSSPSLMTNFVSEKSSVWYSNLYKEHGLLGAHVIKLGKGNDQAALDAIGAWKNNLQVGGGITADNARYWLDNGAVKVIITSWLFPENKLSLDRLTKLATVLSPKELVIDLSCRKTDKGWFVATNRWQTITETELNKETIDLLTPYCSEFLIHAADVEGLCKGIDEDLVKALGEWVDIPCTYAGGGKTIDDLEKTKELSKGKVDLTIGSSLDIFGGNGTKFLDCVAWNNKQS